MSRLSPRWISIAISVLGVGMVLSLVLSYIAISRQTDVAKREAARAVAAVAAQQKVIAAQQVALAAQQQSNFQSDCRILAIGLPKPEEPPSSTALGRARALQYEAEYAKRGCPP